MALCTVVGEIACFHQLSKKPRITLSDTMGTCNQQASLPSDLDIKKASFWARGSVSNIKRGTWGDCDYAAFDYDDNTQDSDRFTVIALKTTSPTTPTTHLSRASGIQLERLGEWVVAFEPRRDLRPEQIQVFIDDVLKLLEYANAFPQNG